MKSVLLAYLLWFLGGPLGLYKFYLGRPFMGLFYVFTCGGLFIGWMYDFFTLPYQVQVANVLLQYQPEHPTSALQREIEHLKGYLYALLQEPTKAAAPAWRAVLQERLKPQRTDDDLMLKLLRAAQKHQGRLSVTQGVIETGVPFAEVERVLQHMVKSSYVYMDNDPATGVIVYVFKELF